MEAILDSLLGSCNKRLQAIITEEAIMNLRVIKDLQKLNQTVNRIQCFLSDAEKRRADQSAVNNWLSELKDAINDADDIIDMTMIQGSKLLHDHISSSINSAACKCFSCLSCLPKIRRRHEISIQIRNINARLEKISLLGERFFAFQNVEPRDEVLAVRRRTASALVESNLVGKEIMFSSRKLVELILNHRQNKPYKICIVGTGGVGKTTLAQKIYNDHKIKGIFSKQAWICVSQEYSEVALLKEVLGTINVDYRQDESTGELSRKLAAAVEGKSFFLVLDDVWQHQVWTNLLRTSLNTASAQIVLVTTRNDTVARAIGVSHVHRVELLSEEIGWELLWTSMNFSKEIEVQNLREIGMEIVRMCGGLPLAIKVIACVLATKHTTETEWRRVLNRSAWSMGKVPVELRGALYLSYDDLPWHLKQCFLYCALYPEGYSMCRDDLIRYWVAEGFVKEEEEQLLEDTAKEYYYELIYRNLLQPDPGYFDNSRCRMHGLLRNLANHLSQGDCFCGEPQSLDAKSLSRLRHVSIVTGEDSIMLPNVDKDPIRARTLLIHSTKSATLENLIFSRLPFIRVLGLTSSVIKNIPDSIGSLIHLRSLDLDATDICYLPESIGSLINLQMLNLRWCDTLHTLPLAITQLQNLRRLGLEGTPINQVPTGIRCLRFLNDLEGFPVADGSDSSNRMKDGWNLEELGPLMQLRCLGMINLDRAVSFSTDALLKDKKHLNVLHLRCTEHTNEPYSKEDISNIEKTFERLIPPCNLEDLTIVEFFGQRFPTWLGTRHLSSLRSLMLIGCKSCVHLPPVGQLPNLKHLKIMEATAVTKIGPEFLCSDLGNSGSLLGVFFPKLEWLVIQNMYNLRAWSFVVEEEVTAADLEGREDEFAGKQKLLAHPPKMWLMPRLKRLELIRCPKLRVLPQQFGQEATNLKELLLEETSGLVVVENFPYLCGSLSIKYCSQLERVSNLPRLRELHVAHCPNLMRVEELDSLQQLWLGVGMEDNSSVWIHELQHQHRQLHDEDLDVYTWPR